MRQYDSYKESGVQWIGKIPSHWKCTSFIYGLRSKISDGPHETPALVESGIPFISIDSLNDTKDIDFSVVKKFISEKDYVFYCKKTKLEYGDILFSKAATIGKTAIVGNDVFMIWSPLAILKPKKPFLQSNYLYYLVNCSKLIEETIISGSMSTQVNVGMRELEKVKIPIPDYLEQQAIASYLDKKCGEIDKAIETQTKRIELLKELRQNIITNAVTRGLNPNAPLKDSGVEWIGQVPEHWEICAFKHKMTINNGSDYKDYLDKELYPVMGSGGCFAYCSRFIYDGEVVLLGRKGTIDHPLYFKGKFWAVDTMFYAIPKKEFHCKFAYYLALTFPFKFYSTSTALPSMTQTDLGNNPVACPPFHEQQDIATYLDKKCNDIDKVIDKSKHQITLLQELKQSIITEVVTGKRKVC